MQPWKFSWRNVPGLPGKGIPPKLSLNKDRQTHRNTHTYTQKQPHIPEISNNTVCIAENTSEGNFIRILNRIYRPVIDQKNSNFASLVNIGSSLNEQRKDKIERKGKW